MLIGGALARCSMIHAEVLWPPVDRAFDSAQSWHLEAKQAPPLSASELLAVTKTVQIKIRRDPEITEILKDDETRALVTKTVRGHGLAVDGISSTRISVKIALDRAVKTSFRNGRETGKNPIHAALVETRIELPARVMRAGWFRHVVATPVVYRRFRVDDNDCTRAQLVEDIVQSISSAIQGGRGLTEKDSDDAEWSSGLGAESESERLFSGYRNSWRSDLQFGTAAVEGITGFESVSTEYLGLEKAPLFAAMIRDPKIQARWGRKLQERQFAINKAGEPHIIQDLLMLASGRIAHDSHNFAALLIATDIYNSNCLVDVNNRLHRMRARIHLDASVDFMMNGEILGVVRKSEDASMDRLVSVLARSRKAQSQNAPVQVEIPAPPQQSSNMPSVATAEGTGFKESDPSLSWELGEYSPTETRRNKVRPGINAPETRTATPARDRAPAILPAPAGETGPKAERAAATLNSRPGKAVAPQLQRNNPQTLTQPEPTETELSEAYGQYLVTVNARVKEMEKSMKDMARVSGSRPSLRSTLSILTSTKVKLRSFRNIGCESRSHGAFKVDYIAELEQSGSSKMTQELMATSGKKTSALVVRANGRWVWKED